MTMTNSAVAEPDSQPGRLERRKARTRSAILEAAGRLFCERGYEETSIQQIAEAADTGVGTVYGYFESKEHLLFEVLRQHSSAAVQRYRAAVDETTPAIDRICAALASYAQYMRDSRPILAATFRVASRDHRLDEQSTRWLFDPYCQMLSEGIAKGEIRPLPVDTTVRMLIGTYTIAMLGIGIWRGQQDDPRTLADLQRLTRDLLAPSGAGHSAG